MMTDNLWNFSHFTAAATGSALYIFFEGYNLYFRERKIPELWKSWIWWVVNIIMILMSAFFALLLAVPTAVANLLIGFAMPAVISKMVVKSQSNVEEEDLRETLRAAEKKADEKPEEARPVWEVSRLQLELYIRRNQSQVKAIFWATIVVMFFGFGLISFGVYIAISTQILNAAILTTASGVLIQFIAATFLFIYKSTMEQASAYVGTLERINSVGMSIQILDAITDANIKNSARSDIINQILSVEQFSRKSARAKAR